ncbi:hypothetical protein AB0F81_04140 [Actinoplanes sp. NPDC024001]|uniref:hypothetical protein n=1 Tax=Actinoplanes sp. NPDC024001 TaxID=3154598 RepID=UPI0033F68C4F
MGLDDPTHELRWYLSLAVLFFAVGPVVALALVASDAGAAGAWAPVLVAVPINLVGAVFAVMSMSTRDSRISARRLATAVGVVLLGDIALFGIRALVA